MRYIVKVKIENDKLGYYEVFYAGNKYTGQGELVRLVKKAIKLETEEQAKQVAQFIKDGRNKSFSSFNKSTRIIPIIERVN